MADTAIAINDRTGTSKSIDVRTDATNGDLRQVVVIGDPATNAGVAPVDVTHGLAVQGGVASGATDSGNPQKMGGKYNASAPTLTDGQRGDLQLDASANTKVSQATRIAGEDLTKDLLKVNQVFSATNITTNATTTVQTGAGLLHSFTINNPALISVANLTMTVYDNTAGSGTKIGTYTVPFGLTTAVPFTVNLNASFATGLTIVTAGPTVAADITVNYR